MSKSIVYLVGALHKPGNRLRIICQKINWLAENTGYKVHVVLTEGADKQLCYDLSPKVRVVNLNINYDELKEFSLFKRLFSYVKKQRLYKRLLTDYLLKVAPIVTVSVIRYEISFLYKIMDGSYKIGELHFDKNIYKSFYSKYFSFWINRLLMNGWYYRCLYQLKRMDAFVVETEEAMNGWENVLPNMVTIPNPLKEYPKDVADSNTQKVLALGNFNQNLGFNQLILAWEHLAPKYPEWRLHLYGNGDQSYYKELIKERKLTRYIQCHSCPNDLSQIYPLYSLLVQMCEHDDYGRYLMEAMSYGLPCIALDVSHGPKDLIQDEKNGFLIVHDRLSDFTSKLGLLIHDNELRHEMQKYAREFARKYTLDSIMPRWVDFLDKFSH